MFNAHANLFLKIVFHSCWAHWRERKNYGGPFEWINNMKVVKFTHTHSLARAHAYSKTQNIYGVMKTSHLIFWENLSFFSLDLTSAVAVVVGVTHFLSLLRRALSPLEYNRNYILNMRYIPKWSKSCTHCTYIIFFGYACACLRSNIQTIIIKAWRVQ